jgi:hypothetical protein
LLGNGFYQWRFLSTANGDLARATQGTLLLTVVLLLKLYLMPQKHVHHATNSIKGFLGPRANAELVPKFHVALHASHAACIGNIKNFALTNMILTFDFELDHPVHGGYG